MFASRRAKRYIERLIDRLSVDQLQYKRKKIEDAIEWFYAQGTFSKKQFNAMNTLLSNKYSEVYDEWMQKVHDECERDYMAKMKNLGINP